MFNQRSVSLLLLSFITVIFMFAPVSAAYAADIFEPASNDISVRILNAVFGKLIDIETGNIGQDPMLAAIKAFNIGVLALGGVLAAYTVLAGTIGTAHDGKMLGRKFSTLYVPLRYTIGTTLILPIYGGGYCLAQAAVMWLVLQGVGIADTAWETYFATLVAPQVENANEGAVTGGSIRTYIRNEFSLTMCEVVNQNIVKEAEAMSQSSDSNTKASGNLLKETIATIPKFGTVIEDSQNSIIDKIFNYEGYSRTSLCGQSSFAKKIKSEDKDIKKAVVDSDTGKKNIGLLGNIGAIFSSIPIPDLAPTHKELWVDIKKELNVLAQKLYDAKKASKLDETAVKNAALYIRGLENYYLRKLTEKVNQDLDGKKNEIIENATQKGWALAGAWFNNIILTQELITEEYNKTPKIRFKTLAESDRIKFENQFKSYSSYYDIVNEVLNVFPEDGVKKDYRILTITDDAETAAAAAKDVSHVASSADSILDSLFATAAEKGVKALIGKNFTELQNANEHPIITLAKFGERLEEFWWSFNTALVSIVAGAAIAAGVVSFLTSFFPILSMAGDRVQAILGASVTVGLLAIDIPINAALVGAFSFKYLLPFVPYVIWIGALIGWLLLVIEAILAAPLWIVMHLHPDGDDITGLGGNGYALVLALIIKPILMLFGFLAALVVSSLFGEFINKTFFSVVGLNIASAETAPMTLLFAVAATASMYFIMMYTLLRNSFSLIHKLPDEIMNWIGLHEHSLGDYARDYDNSVRKHNNYAKAGAAAIAKDGRPVGLKAAKRANNERRMSAEQDKIDRSSGGGKEKEDRAKEASNNNAKTEGQSIKGGNQVMNAGQAHGGGDAG